MNRRLVSAPGMGGQIVRFVVFVASGFPLFYLVIALSLLVLIFEYVATSLMIPLSSGALPASGVVSDFWRRAVEWMGLPPGQRTWLWLFLLAMTARLVLGYFQTICAALLGKMVHKSLSGRIFRHVVADEPLVAVYARSVGHYITLAGDDTFRAGTIVTSLLQCLVGVCSASVSLLVLYQFSATAFYAVCQFLVLCALLVAVLLRHLLGLNRRSVVLSRELGTHFVEALNSLRSIRSLRGERFVSANYAAQIARYVRMLFTIEAIKTGAKSFPAVLLLIAAAVFLRPSAASTLTEGALVAGTVIVIRIFAALGQLMTAGGQLLTDIRAVGDIRMLTGTLGEAHGVPLVGSGVAIESLALEHIDYGYRGHARILHDVCFRFEHGKTYAIIGPSGSGKSTLADIILGLIPQDRGTLVVNDGRLGLDAARARMMLVEQQPKIFSNSVRDNLLFGYEAADEQLWETLRLVGMEGHIRGLHHGLDAHLSYLGENLSGGQRQRIGIARALVRNPDLLILDEATSALDTATRALVVHNVRKHMKQGIIVFITHDGEIASLADEVMAVVRPLDMPAGSP